MTDKEEIYQEILALMGENKELLPASKEVRENFIKATWTLVQREDDDESINRSANNPNSTDLWDHNALIAKFIEAGVSPKSIARYTKIMHYQLLFDLLCMFEDSREQCIAANIDPPEYWGLFETDEDDDNAVIKHMRGMQEMLLKFDPSQREMRPPKDSKE